MSYLVLQNVTKKYGDLVVVDNIDLAMQEGDFISLLGPSGCGKTTTLRMIAGFGEPSSGRIYLKGQEISSPDSIVPPEHRGMSMIFQSYAIWPNMTVGENVGFGLQVRKVKAEEIKRRVGEILEVVKMSHLIDRYPAELSGGQQQRVALARSIVVKPSVLLLDEPLSNLDANLREEMRIEIRRLHDEFRTTTVYVTHDQSEAMATADKIAVMSAGKIEQLDPPHVVYTRPKTPFVAAFIGRTNLLRGTIRDRVLDFGGFSFPLEGENAMMAGANGQVRLASIRPQSMTIMRDPAVIPATMTRFSGKITQRCYLGEHWDYTVSAGEGEMMLKVAANPLQTHEVGEEIWLALDHMQVALVDESEAMEKL